MSPRDNVLVDDELEIERGFEDRLRPASFSEFVGQDRVCQNLRVFIQAARERSEPLDHALFYGPPGLGKTALAHVVAREMGAPLRSTAGPVIERAGGEVDPASGGVDLYARIKSGGPDTVLRPGAFVEVVVADRVFEKVARLPIAALHEGNKVYAVVGERLEEELWGRLGNTRRADSLLGKSITPYDVAEEILGSILASSSHADPHVERSTAADHGDE